MIKTEPKLKELTINDKADIIETVSDYIIRRDENGIVQYMPYLKNYAMTVAIALYAIDGVKFEEDDDIYDIAINDEDISILIKRFMNDKLMLVAEIENHVADVVEFKKNYIIHNNHIVTNKVLEILNMQKAFENFRFELAKKENKFLDQQIEVSNKQNEVMKLLTPEEIAELDKKMLSGEYGQKEIADAVLKSYIDAGIIHPSKEKIVDMKKKTSSPRTKKTTKSAKVTNKDKNE